MARKSRKNIETTEVQTASRVTWNAAAYVRLSTDDRRKKGDSLATQRHIIENFVSSVPDIRIVDIYSDNNATGTNFERPGFQKMLTDAENGRINCIIVKDLSRFGRNAIDAGFYLEKYLPSLNVRFIAVTDDYDSLTDNSGIILPLKNVIAESYALDISRKCRTVQQQHIKDGLYVGRSAPFGYMVSPENCHKLVINPETAPIVRMMFDLYSQGTTLGQLTRYLNENALITPSKSKFGDKESQFVSKYWKLNTVRDMLDNSVYAGDMVQGKSRKVNGRTVRIPKSDWICVRDTHEAIVGREQFDTVRVMLVQAAANRREPVRSTRNILRRKIFCGKCGRPMHRHSVSDGGYSYRCTTKWDVHKEACVVVSCREEAVIAEILALLHKHSEALLGHFIQAGNAPENSSVKEIRELNTQIDKNERMVKSLYESMVSGLIDADEFVAMKSDYAARNDVLTSRLDEIFNERHKTDAMAKDCRELEEAVRTVLADNALTEDMIDRLVESIYVFPDKDLKIRFRFSDMFKEVA